MEEKQPWTTCLFTDILLSYLEETVREHKAVDYSSLLDGVEGFQTPIHPERFLRDVNNWVPLPVLRELLLQGESATGKKDYAYHAARAYFDPKRRQLSSLFEIIVRVLNDIRSVLICSNLWGAVQTNYLKLQPFGGSQTSSELYMLAQFDEKARPSIGAIHLLRGICEGFPRLYPFIEDLKGIEEISQLRIEDVVSEFPDFVIRNEGEELAIYYRDSRTPAVRARRVALRSERISLSPEHLNYIHSPVIVPENSEIRVLTEHEQAEREKGEPALTVYKIVQPGTLTRGTLSHSLEKGGIYNAPYCRFRFLWKGILKTQDEATVDEVRREISQLLFSHLKQMRDAQMRLVQHHIEKRQLALENIYLRREIEREYSFGGIVGSSPKLQELFRTLRSIAETDVTVLIQGETGTGKELIARAIHYNSPRRIKRFVAINCGALSETLLESELFGHEKGAFTGATSQRKGIFELADGGTLLLDEIGETTPSTQVKLLRVLQEGELQRVGGGDAIKVDVRVIAATNQNLEELVAKGRFRQDLFYRLNVFPVLVPPLRERLDDIPLLVSHFIRKRQPGLKQTVRGVSPEAMALLLAYGWPGNVRELENIVQRMVVVARNEVLDVQDLPPGIQGKATLAKPGPKNLKEIARDSAEVIEKNTILDALAKTGGNVTRAARALGVSRATLQNKMKRYGLRSSNK